MKKEKILVIPNDPFSEYFVSRGKETVEKYFNPLLKFEVHIVSFEDCYKYPSKKIGTLIIHPFCEKQFRKTWFYPWRIIRVLSRILLRVIKVIRIVKKEKIKLIRAYGMSILCLPGLLSAKITRTPFVISLHNDYDCMYKLKGKLKGLLWHYFEKFIIKFSDFVIAVSPFLVDYTVKHGNKKVIYIPNPIGLDKFLSTGKGRTIREKRKTLLFAGRFYDPQKNFKRLLIAYSKVKKELRENTELLVLGDDGGKIEYFKDLTKKLGIEENVKFAGKVPRTEMPQWYEKADFFVFPSLYEALPNALIEAMATGLPVLTSSHPSCTYLVDEKNGIIVNPLKINEIKEGIENFLKMNVEEYKNKSKSSLEKVKIFRDEVVFVKVASLYEKLIKK